MQLLVLAEQWQVLVKANEGQVYLFIETVTFV